MTSRVLSTVDWHQIPDMTERRKIQNRIAQRTYREKRKKMQEQQDDSSGSQSSNPRNLTPDNVSTNEVSTSTSNHQEVLHGATGTQAQCSPEPPAVLRTTTSNEKLPDFLQHETDDILSWPTPQFDAFDLPDTPQGIPPSGIDPALITLPSDTVIDARSRPDSQGTSALSNHTTLNSPSTRQMNSSLVSAQSNLPVTPVTTSSSSQSFSHDKSALHMAAQNGHCETVQLLLERGIDPSLQDRRGRTALHLAVENGHEDVIGLLLNRTNVNLEQRDHLGYTPLHVGVAKGHQRVVRLLLSRGANIMARTGLDPSRIR